MALPRGTTGSLSPTFVPAPLVSVAVRLPSAFALFARFPTALREPLGASERVTEAPKGSLSAVGNRAKSAKAEGSLTATLTSGAGTKVGLSDPVVPRGRAIAQRIKATSGITG